MQYDSGVSKGYRPVRWDASGTAATELGILGLDSSGETETLTTSDDPPDRSIPQRKTQQYIRPAVSQPPAEWGINIFLKNVEFFANMWLIFAIVQKPTWQ